MSTPIIRRRLEQPPPASAVVARPRLTTLLDRLTAGAGVVAVTATAGSGKTTAVREFAAARGLPVAWLACDASDAATGRLLLYLETALHEATGRGGVLVAAALDEGVPHGEVAGLLAEAVADVELLLILDETERWDDAAGPWRVLASFARYAGPGTRIVLVGRREPPAAHLGLGPDQVRVLGDVQLALTVEEATQVLRARSTGEDVDPRAAVESTGGWMTGVLFEAWRAEEHIDGTGGESDALNGYLSSHILSELDPADRDFLVTTAVLEEVTAGRATALGVPDAAARLATLRRARFPCTWTGDGRVLRCHTRFREFLESVLGRRETDAVRAIHRAHAALLVEEGHEEEAVGRFQLAGATDEALAVAARRILAVLERGDVELAGRWLDGFDDELPADVPTLEAAQLMLAIGREDFRRALALVERLDRRGGLEPLLARTPVATALVAWTYLHAARTEDYVGLMRATGDEAVRRVVEHAARVVFDHPGSSSGAPPLTGSMFDGFVLVARYCLGRIGDLAATPLRGWTDVVASPWVLAAIRDTGQTQRALELYEAAMAQAPSSVLDVYVGPELLMDAGLIDRARECVDRGLVAADAGGSLGLQGLSLLSKARLALRVDDDPVEAERVLDLMEARGVQRFAFIAEAMRSLRGLARLRAGDVTGARAELEAAVTAMQTGDRVLGLPAAAVWLAEACWLDGDEDAADAAADSAVAAADVQGSDHLLAEALRAFPAVLSRRLDAEEDPDSRWFEIARVVRSGRAAARPTRGTRLHVRELGTRTLELDGEPLSTGIAKAHELLAAMAALDRSRMPRAELMDLVFDGRTDRSSRTYLRQALSRLRQALPEGVISVDEETVTIAPEVRLTSDSQELLRELAEAASLRGGRRHAALTAALARWDAGPYLAGVRGGWAELRERELRERVTEASDDAAGLALGAGAFAEAERLARAALHGDPYRESAWRTLMRVHHALGDEPGVIRVYDECRTGFAALGSAPSSSTRQLLETLRR